MEKDFTLIPYLIRFRRNKTKSKMAAVSWRKVKEQIDKSKDYVDKMTEREKTDMEKVYEIASQIDEYKQATESMEKGACLAGVTKKFIGLIKPYVRNPDVKKALDVCENALEDFARGYEIVNFGLALKAFEANPGAACIAAWGGPTVAKAGIDFIRWVAPSLDTDAETKRIENRVFELVGGGAGAGAGGGALIGGAIGFLMGGPPGAAAGAAAGAALGGCAGSVTGAVILAL